jgi:hypothetical protein
MTERRTFWHWLRENVSPAHIARNLAAVNEGRMTPEKAASKLGLTTEEVRDTMAGRELEIPAELPKSITLEWIEAGHVLETEFPATRAPRLRRLFAEAGFRHGRGADRNRWETSDPHAAEALFASLARDEWEIVQTGDVTRELMASENGQQFDAIRASLTDDDNTPSPRMPR